MTQQYTPVTWQDETTSQQGTLINAERLNQMQQAHHYADGLEEVDAIPTADPGVSYHKIVYCTADSTIYRWDGTEWTKDIDDETKALLQQEIARATAAESEIRGQLEDEHDARVDAEAAINDRITDEATELAQRITTEASTRYTADTALGTRITAETSARETADTNLGNRITAEATARADADTALGGRIDTEQARAEAAEQANAQAIANTYTKAEIDTALGAKADVATTYTKTEADTLLALKADQATTYTKAETDTLLGAKANDNAVVHLAGAETIPGAKTFTNTAIFQHDDNNVVLSNPNYTAGTNPSSNKYNGIIFRGSTATSQGWISHVAQADGATRFQLRSYNMSGQSFKQMEIFSLADGTGYATVPTPPAGAPETAVPTINWVSQTGDSAPSNLLHKTGNEKVTGTITSEQPFFADTMGTVCGRTLGYYKTHKLGAPTNSGGWYLNILFNYRYAIRLVHVEIIFTDGQISNVTASNYIGGETVGNTAVTADLIDGEVYLVIHRKGQSNVYSRVNVLFMQKGTSTAAIPTRLDEAEYYTPSGTLFEADII